MLRSFPPLKGRRQCFNGGKQPHSAVVHRTQLAPTIILKLYYLKELKDSDLEFLKLIFCIRTFFCNKCSVDKCKWRIISLKKILFAYIYGTKSENCFILESKVFLWGEITNSFQKMIMMIIGCCLNHLNNINPPFVNIFRIYLYECKSGMFVWKCYWIGDLESEKKLLMRKKHLYKYCKLTLQVSQEDAFCPAHFHV